MVTRECLKREIDRVQDSYLDVLFHIIQAFEHAPSTGDRETTSFDSRDNLLLKWHKFIETTYGSLSADPIERGDQGI